MLGRSQQFNLLIMFMNKDILKFGRIYTTLSNIIILLVSRWVHVELYFENK